MRVREKLLEEFKKKAKTRVKEVLDEGTSDKGLIGKRLEDITLQSTESAGLHDGAECDSRQLGTGAVEAENSHKA